MKIRRFSLILAVLMVLSLAACTQEKKAQSTEPTSAQSSEPADLVTQLELTAEPKDASSYTVEVNSALYSLLDFSDTQEADFATRGLIDAPETLELKNEAGEVIWSQTAYSFLDDYTQAPATANPSLWENTKNNHAYGLFEVTEGIYQVRGYDMANLTVVAGENGWIVFDPLMSVECTKAAMELVDKNLGKRPVMAVIISHCHVDHYGGVRGILDEEMLADGSLPISEQLSSGKTPVIVPEGFTEHAVSENVYAGRAMGRRANYQYGVLLEPGVTGKMAMGIGIGQSTGTVSFIAPTYEIKQSGERIDIDGVEFEFQLTPNTEAPAEMNTWLPQFKALWMAENCTGTLHNLYTLRGAQVRDGAAWAQYIMEALSLYGEEAQVVFQSHNWPHWDNEVVREYMTNTAAVYKFINDQTLTYINQGYTSDEISNMIELPQALAKNWYTRQYYGTVAHNSKAVYQKYMGWYDANPVHLNPLTPTESAIKWVEYLGDVDEALRMAKNDFDAGEYQWVAEITNVILFADPENTAARLLCADALEQLGYQAESGPWRNAYLSAAKELREGNLAGSVSQASTTGDIVKNMTAPMLIDYIAIRLHKQALADRSFKVNLQLDGGKECYTLHFVNGVLLYTQGTAQDAELAIACPKNALLFILQGNAEGVAQSMRISGDTALLDLILENMTEFSISGIEGFNIVEP